MPAPDEHGPGAAKGFRISADRLAAPLLVGANASVAAVQLLCIVILARRYTIDDVGEFASLTAVAAPLFAVLTVGVRLWQLREPSGVTNLWRTLIARLLGGVVAVVGTLAVTAVLGLAGLALAAAVVAWRFVDTVADFAYTGLQVAGRTRLMSGLVFFRAVAAVVAFWLGSVAELPVAALICLVSAIGLAQTVFVDTPLGLRAARSSEHQADPVVDRRGLVTQSVRVFAWAIPLGVAAAAVSLTFTAPRLVLAAVEGPDAVSRYSIATILFPALSLLTSAIGYIARPPLSTAFRTGRRHAFEGLLRRMLMIGLAASVLSAVVYVVLAGPVIEAVLGPDYRSSSAVFGVLGVALVFAVLGTFYQDGLTSGGLRAVQVKAFGASALTTGALALVLVAPLGEFGAALAFGAGCVVQAFLLQGGVRRMEWELPG